MLKKESTFEFRLSIFDFFRSLALLLAMLAFSGNGLTQVLEQTFSDEVAGFKISTPNSRWHFEPRGSAPGAQRAMILFESPLHQFLPNVSVRLTETLDTKTSLEDFFQKEQEALPSTVQILEKKKISRGQAKGYELSWKDPASGILFLQWFFLVNQRQYILTCAAKEESYPRVLPDFRLILNSFQLL
jgi:hypothetical protein